MKRSIRHENVKVLRTIFKIFHVQFLLIKFWYFFKNIMLGLKLSIFSSLVFYKKMTILEIELGEDLMDST